MLSTVIVHQQNQSRQNHVLWRQMVSVVQLGIHVLLDHLLVSMIQAIIHTGTVMDQMEGHQLSVVCTITTSPMCGRQEPSEAVQVDSKLGQ